MARLPAPASESQTLFEPSIDNADVAEAASVLAAAVLRGDCFTAFTADNPETRARVLEMLADILAQYEVHVASGVENVAAIEGPTSDGEHHASHTLSVIENAEALPPRALGYLGLVAATFSAVPRTLQVLFVGGARFQARLLSHEYRSIREHIVTNLAVGPNQPPLGCDNKQLPTRAAIPEFQNMWRISGVAVLALAFGLAVTLQVRSPPAVMRAPAPAAPPVREPLAVALTPPEPATPQPPQIQTQAKQQAQQSPSQTSPQPPRDDPKPTAIGTTPLDESRVVVLFRAGSAISKANARQIAASLEHRVASAQVQSAPDLPRVPSIRYFSHDDRNAAMELGAALAGSAGKWPVRRQHSSRDSVSQPGTIEVRLADQ